MAPEIVYHGPLFEVYGQCKEPHLAEKMLLVIALPDGCVLRLEKFPDSPLSEFRNWRIERIGEGSSAPVWGYREGSGLCAFKTREEADAAVTRARDEYATWYRSCFKENP